MQRNLRRVWGFRCQGSPKGRRFKSAILKARRFRDRAIRLLRPRPFCRTREQTMIVITRRQAIGTIGTAAAFATGLGRPLFAEAADRKSTRLNSSHLGIS